MHRQNVNRSSFSNLFQRAKSSFNAWSRTRPPNKRRTRTPRVEQLEGRQLLASDIVLSMTDASDVLERREAYEIRQQYDLVGPPDRDGKLPNGHWYEAKAIRQWFVLVPPSGEQHGYQLLDYEDPFEQSKLIATFDESFYRDEYKLLNAANPTDEEVTAAEYTFALADQSYDVDEVLNSDDAASQLIQPVGEEVIEQLASWSANQQEVTQAEETLLRTTAAELMQQYTFYGQDTDGSVPDAIWFQSGREWFFMRPDGSVYDAEDPRDTSILVGTLDSTYYDNFATKFLGATMPTPAEITNAELVLTSPNNGDLSVNEVAEYVDNVVMSVDEADKILTHRQAYDVRQQYGLVGPPDRDGKVDGPWYNATAIRQWLVIAPPTDGRTEYQLLDYEEPFENSILVATLDESYYNNPWKLLTEENPTDEQVAEAQQVIAAAQQDGNGAKRGESSDITKAAIDEVVATPERIIDRMYVEIDSVTTSEVRLDIRFASGYDETLIVATGHHHAEQRVRHPGGTYDERTTIVHRWHEYDGHRPMEIQLWGIDDDGQHLSQTITFGYDGPRAVAVITTNQLLFDHVETGLLAENAIVPHLKAIDVAGATIAVQVASPHDQSYIAFATGGLLASQTIEHKGGTNSVVTFLTMNTANPSGVVELRAVEGGTLLDALPIRWDGNLRTLTVVNDDDMVNAEERQAIEGNAVLRQFNTIKRLTTTAVFDPAVKIVQSLKLLESSSFAKSMDDVAGKLSERFDLSPREYSDTYDALREDLHDQQLVVGGLLAEGGDILIKVASGEDAAPLIESFKLSRDRQANLPKIVELKSMTGIAVPESQAILNEAKRLLLTQPELFLHFQEEDQRVRDTEENRAAKLAESQEQHDGEQAEMNSDAVNDTSDDRGSVPQVTKENGEASDEQSGGIADRVAERLQARLDAMTIAERVIARTLLRLKEQGSLDDYLANLYRRDSGHPLSEEAAVRITIPGDVAGVLTGPGSTVLLHAIPVEGEPSDEILAFMDELRYGVRDVVDLGWEIIQFGATREGWEDVGEQVGKYVIARRLGITGIGKTGVGKLAKSAFGHLFDRYTFTHEGVTSAIVIVYGWMD
ncbi:MAG: hypothetical protein O3C40_16355 [Planctomycetota bacterium]|nr:hypothetical protein [Planctomycetota bacterium]